MNRTGGSTPDTTAIRERQGQEANLRRQIAARSLYATSKKLDATGEVVALAIAIAAPPIRWVKPELAPYLAAVAGLWIFANRLVLRPLRDRYRLNGARAQQLFDSSVLNASIEAGEKQMIAEEEIHAQSAKADLASVRDWYPTQTDAAWPHSVMICQRSNASWAGRQHRSFSRVLLCVGIGLFLVGIAVAFATGASLTDYLIALLLPSLPALLDTVDHYREHLAAASRRDELRDEIDEALSNPPTEPQRVIDGFQFRIFQLRSIAPLVPEWFYKRIADRYEAEMRYAANSAAKGVRNG